MSQTDDLRSRLDKAGLSAIANELINQSKESVAMKAAVVPDDAVPLGASKIGGLPDLPANLAWPKWKTGELSFVVQVNLAELPENDMLPSSGLLSFFYDREQSAWGFDPQHKEGFRLWYFPETSGLNRNRAPRGFSFPCARLTFEPFLSLPDSSVIGDLALEMERDEIYAEFLDKYLVLLR